MIIELLQLASSFLLGLLVGSLLTEAIILVPYWRTMPAKEFLALHHSLGPKLLAYFKPLTILATFAPVLTAVVTFVLGEVFHWLSIVPAVLTLIMLVIYFGYFKGANESFKSGSVGAEGLADELARWAKWHWLRVVIGCVAFFVSLLVLSGGV